MSERRYRPEDVTVTFGGKSLDGLIGVTTKRTREPPPEELAEALRSEQKSPYAGAESLIRDQLERSGLFVPGSVEVKAIDVDMPVGQGGAPANTDRAEGLHRQDRGLCPWHDDPEFGCEPCADIINAKYEPKS